MASLKKGGDGRVTGPTDFSVRYLLVCNRGALFVATGRWGAPYTELYLNLDSSNWVSNVGWGDCGYSAVEADRRVNNLEVW